MSAARSLLQTMDYSVVQQCMHCGMCLPTCPTYMETKQERNSPRGRIALMRAVADGELTISPAFGEEMYYCLGCLACETACPAGVKYGELFETARAAVEEAKVLPKGQRDLWRWLTLEVLFMRPRLLRAVGWLLRQYQALSLDRLIRSIGLLRLMPRRLRELEPQTPRMAAAFSDDLIAPNEQPKTTHYRVGMLTGCVQDLAFSNINRDTVDVLLANHCEVITPRAQPCCGSLHAHNGAWQLAQELARRQIDSFDLDRLDAIISNAGGCGSHLKKYGHLLHDDPAYADKAKVWDSKLRDIHEWLAQIGIAKPQSGCGLDRITYHESCHLCHGQKVVNQPRAMLRSIPGLELIELSESSWCCGSAGIYNITQPEQSAKLLARKVEHIIATKVAVVATSNPGCHMQIANGLSSQGITVTQPVTLLATAYRRPTAL
jgi:glycolate oxidase iron-sulfur subunit